MLVRVPPLREHREDITFLAELFLQPHIAANHLEPRRFTRQALRALEQYDWPGNVRELSHVIERAVTLSTGEWIDADEFGLEEVPPLAPPPTAPGTVPAQPLRDLPPDVHFN